MRAKRINEGDYDDLLKLLEPKLPSEIKTALKANPLASLKVDIMNAGNKYWKKLGIRFKKIMSSEEFEKILL